MNIGVLTGGGDCPGLNAAIRAVVHRANAASHVVVGIRDGWAGLATAGAPLTMPLEEEQIRGILALGGTILGSSRTNPTRDESGLDACETNLAALGLDGLVAIGGDDTLSVAAALAARGDPVVGIPKTMDNDVALTESCIGFDSAATTVMEAIDKLQTTAASHHRVMVVEVMGRDAGWVATYAGLAGGADVIIVPEYPYDLAAICERLSERQRTGIASIVVVAEGVLPPGASDDSTGLDAFGHPRLDRRGVGETLGREIESRTGIETRVTVLGHVVRGGAPSLFDRVLATRFGVRAVELLERGAFGRMVALQGGQIVDVPLAEVTGRNRKVDPVVFDLAAFFT